MPAPEDAVFIAAEGARSVADTGFQRRFNGLLTKWTGWADAKLRRKLQNRLNQRARRLRGSEEKSAAVQTGRDGALSATFGRLKIGSEAEGDVDRAIIAREILQSSQAPLALTKTIDTLQKLSPVLEDAANRRAFHTWCSIVNPNFSAFLNRSGSPIGASMIQNSLENPIVLDVNISSIALFRHTHTGCRYDLQAVSSANLRIIQRVREALAKGVVSDNTLLGMLLLTVEVFPVESRHGPERGLLECGNMANLSLLNVFCRFHFRWGLSAIHRRLIEAAGGYENLPPDLAAAFSLTSLISASQTLTPPMVGQSYPTALCRSGMSAFTHIPPYTAENFQVDSGFKELLVDLQRCCWLARQFQGENGKDTNISEGFLAACVHNIQWRVLDLPRSQPQSEVCRLATLVFCLGVLFPLSLRRPIQQAAEMLDQALQTIEFVRGQGGAFLFWATMIGGMAAYTPNNDDSLDRAFVSRLRRLRADLGLRSWNDAKRVLQQFVWQDVFCENGGYTMWQRILKRQHTV